ncbi:MAG TPA: hypothetical protein VM779_10760 [Thermoanaerobaculia bacterium]|nr:hypothetical protein [Thermoanaerobaculia bacterium]
MPVTSGSTGPRIGQRTIFWAVALVCAVSRFASMARSAWDWDEALFLLAMRDYDVTSHHPHPPGFPVYIAMARLVRLVVDSDFRALQSLNLIAGMFVFPALFLYARALGLRFETSVVAGVLFAFFPNVWFFGGTAFSDVVSIVLVLFAVVLLFRGAESRRDYLLGTILLALAIGIRPQNLLVGLFPGILATIRRPFRDVLVALTLGLVITGVAFGAAVYATGDLDSYLRVVREHSDYITRIDSFRNADRPPLWRIFDRFFFKQYQSPALSILISLLVLVSVIGAIRRRDRAMFYNFLTFAPFAITAWMMLDRFSISRFSIGYAPMFAVFAADGIRRLARDRWQREYLFGGALAAAFAVWAFPAFTDVRNRISPSVRAVEAARREIDPRTETLFVGHSMVPFVEYFARELPFIRVIGVPAVPLTPAERPFLLADLQKGEPEGLIFQRPRGRLWNIARRHYFEVVLQPLRNIARFRRGWYPPELEGVDEKRWMGASSLTILPPASGRRELRLLFHVPPPLVGATVTVTLNGQVIDRIQVDALEISRDYEVDPLPPDQPNRLELSIDRTIEENRQQRGLRLRFLSWGRP